MQRCLVRFLGRFWKLILAPCSLRLVVPAADGLLLRDLRDWWNPLSLLRRLRFRNWRECDPLMRSNRDAFRNGRIVFVDFDCDIPQSVEVAVQSLGEDDGTSVRLYF